MPKKKIDWLTINKLIISIEIMLFFIAALIVSSLYFSWDYSNFLQCADNKACFWLGFTTLTAIIVSSGGILATGLISLIHIDTIVNAKDKKNKK